MENNENEFKNTDRHVDNDYLKDAANYANKAVHTFSEKVNNMAGGQGAVDLHLKDIFSGIFEKHDANDAEEIFICGTSKTTPREENISTAWPKPWLYSRIFIFLYASFLIISLCWKYFYNLNALPGVIFLGSFVMPVTVLIFFFEVNAPRNISFFDTLKVFLLGGCASLLATLVIFEIFPVYDLTYFGAIMVGIIEEVGKLLIVAWFISRTPKCKYILNGLLIGGAVGAGFAAFETMGYAFNTLTEGFDLAYESMVSVIYLRGILAPGGHVVWAAISGVAIMIALNGRPFFWNILTDKKFLGLFSLSVIMHAIWDMPIPLFQSIPVIQIVLTAAAWIIVLVLIHNGLEEINRKTSVNQQNNF